MSNWLSKLLETGPILKHWWRENHDGSYRVICAAHGNGVECKSTEVAVVTFNESIPLDKQHAAMARIVKGLDQ